MSPDLVLGVAYAAALGVLALYGVHRLLHLARFRWEDGAAPTPAGAGDLPVVTVQLPLYDEATVAARLLRAVGALDWPQARLQVQVLDDSTDETRAICDVEVARLRAAGVDAAVLRRPDRAGFKAGALALGLERARGELLCVFDADFLPPPDFLRRIAPRFADPRVGMVQARWEHENRDESALTRAQATLLDGHFVIEHKVRYDRGLFFNFNGTAGVWRRAAIVEAGGWQHDTLTEDLDLSYRAQLRGWRFVYAHDVTAPAEVPPDIAAFRNQQHRWAKGSAQVLRKLGRELLTARIPLRVKLEALTHLTANVGYPVVLVVALLLPLVLRWRADPMPGPVQALAFGLCCLPVFLFYDRGQRALGRAGRRRLLDVPAAVALAIGMSVGQTRALVEGLLPGVGEFVRTPKRGEAGGPRRYRAVLCGLPGLELLLAAWFAWALTGAARDGIWAAVPFLALFLAGFTWVGAASLSAGLRGPRA